MKLIISQLLLSFSILETVTGTFLDDRKGIVTPGITECICATGVDPFLVQKWYDKVEYPNDACFKCFLRCVSIKMGVVDTAGTLNDAYPKKHGVPTELVRNCTTKVASITDLCQKSYDRMQCIVLSFLNLTP